jgi:CrcB protein
MKEALLVGLGGGLGALARWGLGRAVLALTGPTLLPWPTLAVNVLGCLAMGGLVARVPESRDPLRVFLGTGVLGGFTTYSAFGAEVVLLAREQPRAALLHAAAHLVLGIGAVALGWALARR